MKIYKIIVDNGEWYEENICCHYLVAVKDEAEAKQLAIDYWNECFSTVNNSYDMSFFDTLVHLDEITKTDNGFKLQIIE